MLYSSLTIIFQEKVTQVSSEKPANQSTKSIDVVDSAQSQAAVTLPAVSITPRPAATSLLSHTRLPNSGQSLPRVLPITAGLIRSANGKFILTNANGASRGILGQPLANARILQTNISESCYLLGDRRTSLLKHNNSIVCIVLYVSTIVLYNIVVSYIIRYYTI